MRAAPIVIAGIAIAAGAAISLLMPAEAPAPVAVTVPADLSAEAQAGRQVFARACASCHGARAEGTDRGPPLVHAIYRPGHHADGAFLLAVRNGVPAHHWGFGDMPPQAGVSEPQVRAIIAYVRALQKANGIY